MLLEWPFRQAQLLKSAYNTHHRVGIAVLGNTSAQELYNKLVKGECHHNSNLDTVDETWERRLMKRVIFKVAAAIEHDLLKKRDNNKNGAAREWHLRSALRERLTASKKYYDMLTASSVVSHVTPVITDVSQAVREIKRAKGQISLKATEVMNKTETSSKFKKFLQESAQQCEMIDDDEQDIFREQELEEGVEEDIDHKKVDRMVEELPAKVKKHLKSGKFEPNTEVAERKKRMKERNKNARRVATGKAPGGKPATKKRKTTKKKCVPRG